MASILDANANSSTNAVIICVSKASSDTSFVVACRVDNINDGLLGEGNPFCLANKEELYIWNNVEVATQKLRVGVIAKYRMFQNQSVYEENTGKIMVSHLLPME